MPPLSGSWCCPSVRPPSSCPAAVRGPLCCGPTPFRTGRMSTWKSRSRMALMMYGTQEAHLRWTGPAQEGIEAHEHHELQPRGRFLEWGVVVTHLRWMPGEEGGDRVSPPGGRISSYWCELETAGLPKSPLPGRLAHRLRFEKRKCRWQSLFHPIRGRTSGEGGEQTKLFGHHLN